MNKTRRHVSIFFLSAVCVFAAAVPPRAHFERLTTSTRSLSLGGAFVATADDPSATSLNPAGLARLDRMAFLTTYQKPYGLADLEEGYAAAALPVRIGVVGLSWHHFGMRGAVSEDLLSIALGRDLVHNTQDASLSVGGSVDLARVSFDEFGAAKNVVTGGVGVLLRPFPSIGIGYAVGNLRQSEFDLAPGDGVTRLTRTHTWGLTLKWHTRAALSMERKRNTAGEWRNHAGLEVVVSPSLVLRSGVDGTHAVGGMGVRWTGLSIDVGVASHERLGSTYTISLGYSPPKKTGPNAQKP